MGSQVSVSFSTLLYDGGYTEMDYNYLYDDLFFDLIDILPKDAKVDNIKCPNFCDEDDYPQCGLFKGTVTLEDGSKCTFEFIVYKLPILCDSMYNSEPEFALTIYKFVCNDNVILNVDPFIEVDKAYETYKQQITEKGVMS